jgi:hypothetical protein
MLAEHGTLGILGLLILLFTPLVLYLENKFNMFCCVLLLVLTINHAAMRNRSASFLFSLSLKYPVTSQKGDD